MIFVTVGTHEQQFDRLIQAIDQLKMDGVIEEEVIMQTGFCKYIPKCCLYEKMMPYQKIQKSMHDARIIITHGGPSSFLLALSIGKTPIVVPRRSEFGEHVNDHQLNFLSELNKRGYNIPFVTDINDLQSMIEKHNNTNVNLIQNNKQFTNKLKSILIEITSKDIVKDGENA